MTALPKWLVGNCPFEDRWFSVRLDRPRVIVEHDQDESGNRVNFRVVLWLDQPGDEAEAVTQAKAYCAMDEDHSEAKCDFGRNLFLIAQMANELDRWRKSWWWPRVSEKTRQAVVSVRRGDHVTPLDAESAFEELHAMIEQQTVS